MKQTILLILIALGSCNFNAYSQQAGSDETTAKSGESEPEAKSQSAEAPATPLCSEVLSRFELAFGFTEDMSKIPVSRLRSRIDDNEGTAGLTVMAIAKGDGYGPSVAIFKKNPKIEGSHDIIARRGSTTLQVSTGYGEDKGNKVSLYQFLIFINGKKVEVISKVTEGLKCEVDHFKVFDAKDPSAPAPKNLVEIQFNEDDCMVNTVNMDRTGRLTVNKPVNPIYDPKGAACQAAWGGGG
jgi:hypothetical protein